MRRFTLRPSIWIGWLRSCGRSCRSDGNSHHAELKSSSAINAIVAVVAALFWEFGIVKLDLGTWYLLSKCLC